MFELARAAREQLASVRELLAESGLPLAGLDDQFPAAYVVARQGALVGVAGLERYGDFGLLRSVAVSERFRNSGLGRLLVTDRLSAARAIGLQQIFLLTTTAAPYFEKLGFVPTPRTEVPPALATSIEFTTACPASATCLRIHSAKLESG
jgi:amino-acid N-acetyltransferase